MNTIGLRARDIEAYALSTLTAAPDAQARDVIAGGGAAKLAPPAKFARARRMVLMGAILGVAAPAIAFGFLNARVFTPTAAHTHQNPKIAAAINEPGAAGAEPAAMKIVPADVLDPTSSVFIGAGDGSNGSWVRH